MADYLKDVNHIHTLPDFVEGGIDYLPGDFLKEKENLVKFLKVYLERLKAIDEMWVNLSEGRLLKNATGVNLDEIGNQVGIERNGLSDMNYRAIIIILLASAAKHGTRPEVIDTLNQLFGTGNFTTYKGDNYRFDINISKTCFELETALQEIQDMLPMPTHLRLTESSGMAFGFAGDKYALGFGSVHSGSRTGEGGLAHLTYVSDEENTLI
ncbi:hypothetical protein [Cronobacter phage EspYZU12]|nr:glucanase [Cronobacter phage EspYZU08]WAK43538.1 hypothetical protein EspYZU15_38 [Cronobacter phage EspYZU15]WAK45444.1 hypothetical protein EspYZU14_40 [Cronobacter phage EspYZU14]WBF78227.1 hypothetical protein [Cronobacter phage EspYZU12]